MPLSRRPGTSASRPLRTAGIAALIACALGGAPTALAGVPANHVKKVDVHLLDAARAEALGAPRGAVEVEVTGTASPAYTARVDGARVLIDLGDADADPTIAPAAKTTGVVGGVLTQSSKSGDSSVTRVAISLVKSATYRVKVDGNVLRVWLLSDDDVQNELVPAAKSAPKLRDVTFVHEAAGDKVVVKLSGPVVYSSSAKGEGTSRIEIVGASVADDQLKSRDLSSQKALVTALTVAREDGQIVIEAARPTDVTAEARVDTAKDGATTLTWTFTKVPVVVRAAPENLSSKTGIGPDGGVAMKTKVIAGDPALSVAASDDSASSFLSTVPMAPQGRYTGRRIDMDFKDADIHNILRLLADVGKVNIVAADDVSGTVTIKMKNVPWDQALDIILQAKGLGVVRSGNMLRVAKADQLEKEREQAIAKKKQELELAPIETRLIPISYAHAETLASKADALKSPRGSIVVDERTNVLIVRDVAGNLDQIEALVHSLDTQTPQVLIEARIVEATSRYLRDVGIQWGGDVTFSSATGNPTGLSFPSSIGAVGGASDANTPTTGLSPTNPLVANPNFAVNLPGAVGTGAGGALGFTLGSINNILNLNVRLSAAETDGLVRIVSNPRILTLDNREASISQGTLIPFSQVSAQGVQTTFMEAKLGLKVRPHVTADGSIAMHVTLNRDEPDFNQTAANGAPTILKRLADTDLLVPDGATVVIGGIYTRNTGKNIDQVPFFGSIPIIGVLFQRRRVSDTRGELVIFLTPRIVNRAEALGK